MRSPQTGAWPVRIARLWSEIRVRAPGASVPCRATGLPVLKKQRPACEGGLHICALQRRLPVALHEGMPEEAQLLLPVFARQATDGDQDGCGAGPRSNTGQRSATMNHHCARKGISLEARVSA